MAHTLDYANKPPNYSVYKNRAEKSFPNSPIIAILEFKNITSKSCYYCGKEGPNGIDRVDNTVGYTKENCVSCCKHCNYVKGDLSLEDFKTWTKRFVTTQKENNNLEL
jgi:hypothetical protein